MTELALNPRFANYCRAMRKAPDEQLAADLLQYPGGAMAGFILWHRERLGEARKAIPHAFLHGNIVLPDAYDAWLTQRVDEILAA